MIVDHDGTGHLTLCATATATAERMGVIEAVRRTLSAMNVAQCEAAAIEVVAEIGSGTVRGCGVLGFQVSKPTDRSQSTHAAVTTGYAHMAFKCHCACAVLGSKCRAEHALRCHMTQHSHSSQMRPC